jgi:hypothetical protein
MASERCEERQVERASRARSDPRAPPAPRGRRFSFFLTDGGEGDRRGAVAAILALAAISGLRPEARSPVPGCCECKAF